MKTSYILIEAVCFRETAAGNSCKSGGVLSPECLTGHFTESGMCEFLGFQKARAAIAVTGHDGKVKNGSCFFGGFDIPEDEYIRRENDWVRDSAEYIEKLNGANESSGQ